MHELAHLPPDNFCITSQLTYANMEGKKVDNERVNLKSAAIASASCVVFEDPWTRSFFTATTADSHTGNRSIESRVVTIQVPEYRYKGARQRIECGSD